MRVLGYGVSFPPPTVHAAFSVGGVPKDFGTDEVNHPKQGRTFIGGLHLAGLVLGLYLSCTPPYTSLVTSWML